VTALFTILGIIGYLFTGIILNALLWRSGKTVFGLRLSRRQIDWETDLTFGIAFWPFFVAYVLIVSIGYYPIKFARGLFWMVATGHPWENWRERIDRV
jgi:hypothetical protein